ncbi:hypothetical protein G7Y89_g3122 [Cudoniella acicularis]|uniref:NAD-dependent epimerase/dehydratase domain-containing protein n=1 Tax=Cudoniella acicularis TaxID=354080 RepID=A0A8H4W7Z4_9HELO|nr:hypothetical protein G7Y89_g3122 [Cudoniella acicularis]
MVPENNQVVLVTGGTGFIATETILQLITAGYKIIATTRNVSKAQHLYEELPQYKDNVTFGAIPDITVPGTFDDLFKNNQFVGVLHIASPLVVETENIQKDIIDPGPLGVKSLFQSAHKFGGSTLKRIVLTSSGATIMDPFWPKEKARTTRWNEDEWTPVTVEQAVEAKSPVLGYYATKTLAERAAWDFIEIEKPSFDLTTLLPVAVVGPVHTPVKSPAQVEKSAAQFVYSLFNGTRKTAEAAEADYFVFSHIDVRDLARAHVQSLTLPAASNQRINMSTEEIFSPQTILNVLSKHFPELKDRVATGKPDQLFSAGFDPTLFSGAKAKRIFGDEWARSVETTVKDLTAQLLGHEKGFSVRARPLALVKATY